jgi:hypothetical protein
MANHQIGTLGEKNLHAALKTWCARRGDELEVEVDGFQVDIVRDQLLIEIQTRNFSSQRRKLRTLVEKHPVRLVFPVAQEKWITRLGPDGKTEVGRRRSPKKGKIFDIFRELVSIPDLIAKDGYSLEVLLIREEEFRCDDGKGSWRRKGWSISDRRLIKVVSSHLFQAPKDFLDLLPAELKDPFSTLELASAIEQPHWLAQKMAYCLRHMGAIQVKGKKGNALLYSTARLGAM